MRNEITSDNHERELLELIGELINGTATANQRERLNEWLVGGAEDRLTYRRYINLHVALHSCCDSRPEPVEISRRLAVSRGWWRAIMGFAAAIVVVLCGVAAYQLRLLRRHAEQPVATVEPSLVTITKLAKARWEGTPETPRIGTKFHSGILRLVEGLAEVTFHSGARVVLEAPVTMTILGSDSVGLQVGRAVAYVPREARGFSIETPRARVVDFGTEFGVGVRESGDTEVQVFQGVVVARWKGHEGAIVERRVEAGQAVSIDRASELAPKVAAFRPEGFVRTFPTDREGNDPSGPLYNQSRFDTVHVLPATRKPTIDGDLSDWDRSGAFYSACVPPYHENYYVEGMMMYDERYLYLGAHVGDPVPMQSRMDPAADPADYAWRGGSVIVRLAVNPALGWPLQGKGVPLADSTHPDIGHRPQDTSDQIVHITMWHHRPTDKPRLHLSFGMDFHGEQTDPNGWLGAFRMDPNGRGYTLEYAVPWSLLHVGNRPPQAGDVLAANWTVHWSDEAGKLSRGYLVEVTNLDAKPFHFLRGATWGKAVFHDRGNLPPGTVLPRD